MRYYFSVIKRIAININYKINNQIIALELRVVDDKEGNLGVMPLEAALKLASERGLDLIEIAPQAKPPVAKIISFDKFRYQKEKELKKQKTGQKITELKQVRISARAALNDLEIKAKKVDKFLSQGYKVEIMLSLRGREKYNRPWANQKLNEFSKMIKSEYKVTSEPKFGGRGLMVQVSKK